MQNPLPVTNASIKQREEITDVDRVLLFGELLIDDFGDQRVTGGAPFNVARHLRAFGLRPLLISRIGDDTVGDEIMAVLEGADIDFEGVQIDAEHPTGSVRVHMKDSGHTFEILPNQAYDFIEGEDARQLAIKNTPQLIYFGTLAQRGAISRNALQTILANVDAPRMVDLNLRAPWFDSSTVLATLEAADMLKLNRDELDTLAGLLQLTGKHYHEQAENLMSKFAIKKLLLTEGADGAWLINADDTQAAVVGAATPDVIDTVGAGDAFAAVFILGLLRHWPDPFILERADDFARAICRIRGAVPMTDGFYQPFLQEWKIV